MFGVPPTPLTPTTHLFPPIVFCQITMVQAAGLCLRVADAFCSGCHAQDCMATYSCVRCPLCLSVCLSVCMPACLLVGPILPVCNRYLGPDYGDLQRPAGEVTAADLPRLAHESFPLCMLVSVYYLHQLTANVLHLPFLDNVSYDGRTQQVSLLVRCSPYVNLP